MDSARWTQGFEVGKSMAEISAPNQCTRPAAAAMEKKVRPTKDQAINCPRCHSTNTKFCYYNNYSPTQPRYFCKTCRRYWTEGGTLRNVPVGGGSRKNKKPSSTNATSLSSSVSSSHKLIPDLNPSSQFSSENPKILGQGQDLNLGFSVPQEYQHGMIPQFLELPKMENRDFINSSHSNPTSSAPLSTLNFLRNGFNSFVPMAPSAMETNALFGPGFQFQECKPVLAFSVDEMSNGSLLRTNTNLNNEPQENSNGSFLFPVGAMKRESNGSEADKMKGSQENSNGYWNGMLGGGSW